MVVGTPLLAQQNERQLAHDILKELIEINTTDSIGDNTRAAEAMAARFRAAGFADSDIRVLGPAPRKGNMVVRMRGSGTTLKPILFIGHLDVVEAKREDWSFDPFKLVEQEGWFYGRGTQDMKSDDALLAATFIRLKREGFTPARDLILALTSDEEGGDYNGVQWLLKEHRDLIDAEYCINADSGGGQIKDGKRLFMGVQAAEKTYASFRLDVHNKGGHSSLPVKDNAIYELADALGRLEKYEFPVRLNQVSRTFFERLAAISTGQLAGDLLAVTRTPPDPGAVERLSHESYFNALLRTTCVPTQLRGGHAENALPQLAEAVVNCRLVPDDTVKSVQETLVRVMAEPKVEVTPVQEVVVGPFSPLRPDVMKTVSAVTDSTWPGITVIPLMETGATDGKWSRLAGIPTYGVSAIFIDVDDVRAHGKDERVMEQSFYDGVRFDYQLIKRLAGESK
jgi:acetylornithine deacetylase/succinyl-diaminopimelate desuccinylase-like protein